MPAGTIRAAPRAYRGVKLTRCETELRLKRLYDAIEGGVADLNDPTPRDRIDGFTAPRDQARADAEQASALLQSSTQQAITPTMLRNFASTAATHPPGRQWLSAWPPSRPRTVNRSEQRRGPDHGQQE